MAEEHRCQGHRPCANNCGFFGSPATMNLCSKCYRDLHLTEQQQASTKSTIQAALSSSPAAVSAAPPPSLTLPEVAADAPISAVETSAQPGRCGACRKRVGLTGFKCRCGVAFCGTHRYPEKHGCGFDFKKVGRDELARANPVIKADKLNKI